MKAIESEFNNFSLCRNRADYEKHQEEEKIVGYVLSTQHIVNKL